MFSSFTVKAVGTLMQLHQKEIPQLQHMTAFAALMNSAICAEHGRRWLQGCGLSHVMAELWHHRAGIYFSTGLPMLREWSL